MQLCTIGLEDVQAQVTGPSTSSSHIGALVRTGMVEGLHICWSYWKVKPSPLLQDLAQHTAESTTPIVATARS